ncbi:complex I intermediate-associated protein 30, mitochondrial-like [Mya arenaria]|uniref:complex I intermediate-associated protein 30, mitochondrial-like n=1 Tax=Mya arenaria TaxID=6604 RepID=UPI0022E5D97F|nr:complex I intermediate-associated protein 30, mitochondrial-like [Mya arenaria]
MSTMASQVYKHLCYNHLKTIPGLHRLVISCQICFPISVKSAARSKNSGITYCQARHYSAKMPKSNLITSMQGPKRSQLRGKDDRSLFKVLTDGLDIIRVGIPKFKKEMRDKINFDFDGRRDHGDFEYFVKFDEKIINSWFVSADSDSGDGKSRAELIVSPNKKALFCGNLITEVPQDGVTKRSGFCNLSSPSNKKSFEQVIPYDWTGYTDMTLRVRGDGRNYMIVIQMDRKWNVHQSDMYNYPLYTRGGPYWQEVNIPLSKFFLTAAGRIQDSQEMIQLHSISDLGITLADGNPGPFQLEIDYIALVNNKNATRYDFDIEMYERGPLDY